jgi:glycerophosphoryl diester phosphodiesterase
MKVIIAGTRTITDYAKVIEAIENSGFHLTEIVCGGASGVDALGKRYGEEFNILVKVFKADWDQYGRAAGPKRNEEMAKYADGLVLVWDGKSRGSSNMLSLAHRYKLPVYTKLVVKNKKDAEITA